MGLIKCNECGQDVSDKASSCPHCGNPLNTASFPPKEVEPQVQKMIDYLESDAQSFSFKRVLIAVSIIIVSFVLLALLFPSFVQSLSVSSLSQLMSDVSDGTIFEKASLQNQSNSENSNLKNTIANVNSLTVQDNPDGSKLYPVQLNNLWGYVFYTSKVDQTGSIDIGSEPKQTIAKLFKALGFPPNLTKSLLIVNVDPTLIRKNDKVQIPWAGTRAVALAMQPEGGLYQTVANGSVIFLNNLYSSDLSIATHELGHQIGFHLTDAEWVQFYKLREIPTDTPRHSSNWNLAPEEDFAEVYKAVYKSSVPTNVEKLEDFAKSGDWSIRTQYGQLKASHYGMEDYKTPCYKLSNQIVQSYIKSHPNNSLSISDLSNAAEMAATADPKVQECRKKNNGPSEWGGMLYVSQLDKPTEQFIKNVVARLNGS